MVADRPAIEPLAEIGPADVWAVLLLDGEHAGLLEGNGDRLEIAKRVEAEDVARMLRTFDEERGYRRIFVGANERLYGELREQLPQQLLDRVHGRFDAGADWESVDSVRERLDPLLVEEETHREHAALERLPTKGVRGIADVLEPLYERRVETLLIEPGIEHPGVVCPRCRWAAAEERGACPVDGEEMVEHPNLVEWAVEIAVAQDADVLPVRRHNDLADHGGIAAVLRF